MRDPRSSICLGALAAASLLGSCGDYSNRILTEDLEFIHAVPGSGALALRVADPTDRVTTLDVHPGELSALGQAVLGDPATYYLFSHGVSEGVNQAVFGMLAQIEWVVRELPPTTREPGRRLWGPWPAEGLPEVDMRFSLVREAAHFYGFRLQMRPAALRDEVDFESSWSDCLYGGLEPGGSDAHRGRGNLTVDLLACAQATGSRARGFASVGFDTRPSDEWPTGITDVQILFVDFLTEAELAEDADAQPLNALYRYLELGDHSGAFSFLTWTDVNTDDPLRPALERVGVLVRWDELGAGRALAQVSQGDMGALVLEVSECWDARHARVFYQDSLDLAPSEGDAAACPAGLPEL